MFAGTKKTEGYCREKRFVDLNGFVEIPWSVREDVNARRESRGNLRFRELLVYRIDGTLGVYTERVSLTSPLKETVYSHTYLYLMYYGIQDNRDNYPV